MIDNNIFNNKKVVFHTLGCKLNFAESSTLIRKFTESGYSVLDFKETADLYVIHSCIVTQQAEHKCIASIRQAKKRNFEQPQHLTKQRLINIIMSYQLCKSYLIPFILRFTFTVSKIWLPKVMLKGIG